MFYDTTNSSQHITLNLRTHSGIIDVHRTWVNEKKERQDLTLFAIKSSDLLKGLTEASNVLPLTFPRLRALRPIWLHQNAVAFQSVPNPDRPSTEEFWSKGRNRTAFINNEMLSNRMPLTESIREVYQSAESFWYLWTAKRRNPRLVGIAFRSGESAAAPQCIHWIAIRDLTTFIEKTQLIFINLLRKYEIPKDEYHKYPYLTQPPQ